MRVAYVSPLPPERSGVADYSALLLPALRERIDVRVVRRRARSLPRGTDVALYHIGNEPEAHGWILDLLRRRPGVVVLHDFVLHHLVAGTTIGRGSPAEYARALERDAGPVGRLLADSVVAGTMQPLWEAAADRFPLVSEVLDLATGLVVHSRYVERRVRERGYTRPLWRIPHPAWPPPAVATEPLPGRAPVIGCFGHVNASKRVPQLLDAFIALRETHPDALLVLAGSVASSIGLDARLERLRLAPGRDVIAPGHVSEERLWALMQRCDVCVGLRSPTMGETSGTVLRALSLGLPLVVSDVGWFGELPGAVAAKVPVDDHEVPTLVAFLRRLADDTSLRTSMSTAAAAYARTEHDLDRVADLYAAALGEGPALDQALLDEAARTAEAAGRLPVRA